MLAEQDRTRLGADLFKGRDAAIQGSLHTPPRGPEGTRRYRAEGQCSRVSRTAAKPYAFFNWRSTIHPMRLTQFPTLVEPGFSLLRLLDWRQAAPAHFLGRGVVGRDHQDGVVSGQGADDLGPVFGVERHSHGVGMARRSLE